MTKLKIPSRSHQWFYRGSHRVGSKRSEWSPRSVASFLGCTVQPQERPRHAKTETTGEFLPSLEDRMAALDSHGTVVSVARDFTPEDCHYCEILGALTSVRITNTVDSIEVCFACAPTAIADAYIDQGESDADIAVEVCA